MAKPPSVPSYSVVLAAYAQAQLVTGRQGDRGRPIREDLGRRVDQANQTEVGGFYVPIAYVGGNIIPELIKDIGPFAGRRFFIASARVATQSGNANDPDRRHVRQ